PNADLSLDGRNSWRNPGREAVECPLDVGVTRLPDATPGGPSFVASSSTTRPNGDLPPACTNDPLANAVRAVDSPAYGSSNAICWSSARSNRSWLSPVADVG